eukprot:15159628-Alexandrium_andersonii.AAC.1
MDGLVSECDVATDVADEAAPAAAAACAGAENTAQNDWTKTIGADADLDMHFLPQALTTPTILHIVNNILVD